jgi:two-component system sensor histidine kinase/response regulator
LIENFLIYAQLELLSTDMQKIHALRKKKTMDACGLIERHSRAQAELAGRPEDLELDLANVPVPISEEYLAKIVDELTLNSLKFSPRGRKVRVGLTELSNIILITVTDQGRGFSTENVTKVGAYMQFDRKMQEQQGLGLGLTIAKRLTELHGGTLIIQSERGVKTEVTIKLPKPQ